MGEESIRRRYMRPQIQENGSLTDYEAKAYLHREVN